MLQFNHRGVLVPNRNIPSTVNELKSVFVDQIANTQRIQLYENYIRYSDDLKKRLNGITLLQWIDGSFVTKKNDPGDIDMVTFIDGTIIERLENELESFKFPASLEQYSVDAYLVRVFDRDDKKYPLYVGDTMYWMDAFDKTQRTRNGQRHPKGFLEINY